jgi:hypothetical protein
MAKITINVGTIPNDGTGEPLREAMIKVNANFTEVYGLFPHDPVTGEPLPTAPIDSPVFTGDPQTPTPPAGDADQSIANTEWVSLYFATLESPHFTGDPTAPSPPLDDDDQSLATTEWVRNQGYISSLDPTGFAPLNSPHFVGVPTAPTAPVGTNTDQLATTAFVHNAILANPTSPEGRLTLTSGVPVQVINMSAATTLYYTPFHGAKIPIYDGTNLVMTEFNEMSCLLSDITKNPSDTHVGKLYDWFVWNDAGTLRLGHGPEWTSVDTRSAGTALVMIKGFNTNAVSILNGPAAQRGTYVGTTYCGSVNNQLIWQHGTIDLPAKFHVWNAFNRVMVASTTMESTDSWVYTGFDPINWTMLNESTDNRIEAVIGLQENAFTLSLTGSVECGGFVGGSAAAAIGLDWVSGPPAPPTLFSARGVQTGKGTLTSTHTSTPAAGFHYWQALQGALGGLMSATFYGSANNEFMSGMSFNGPM